MKVIIYFILLRLCLPQLEHNDALMMTDGGYFVNILGKDFPNSFFPLENFRKKQNVRMQFFVKLSGERNSLTRCV